jgi:hypothetical protein
MSIIQSRVLVDWDGDGYVNAGVSLDAPANIFPSSPYFVQAHVRGIQNISGDTLVENVLSENEYGLCQFVVPMGWTGSENYATQVEFGLNYVRNTAGDTPYDKRAYPIQVVEGQKYALRLYAKSIGNIMRLTLNVYLRENFTNVSTLVGTAQKIVNTDGYLPIGVAFETAANGGLYGVITAEIEDGLGGYTPIGLNKLGTVEVTGFDLRDNGAADGGSNPFHLWQAGGVSNAYDDITSYVLSAAGKSGRQDFAATVPYEGTLSLNVNNTTRIFSPANQSSPLNGLMLEGRRVVVQARDGADANWVTFWSGWTKSYDVIAGLTSNQQMSIEAVQGLERLRVGGFGGAGGGIVDTTIDQVVRTLVTFSGYRPAGSPYILQFNKTRFDNNAIITGDEGIFAEIEQGLEPLSEVGLNWSPETPLLTALEEVLSHENAQMWIDRQGKIHVVNREHYVPLNRRRDTENGLYAAEVGELLNLIPEPLDLQTMIRNFETSVGTMFATTNLYADYGLQYVRLTCNSPAAYPYVFKFGEWYNSNNIFVQRVFEIEPNTQYTFSLYAKSQQYLLGATLRFQSWNGTSYTQVGTQSFTFSSMTPDSNGYYQLYVTGTTTADATHARLDFVIASSDKSADFPIARVTGLMMTAGAAVPSKFNDGTQVPNELNLDLAVFTGARYRYGANVINKIDIKGAAEERETNVVVWESPNYIEISQARGRVRNEPPSWVTIPLEFRFEGGDVKRVVNLENYIDQIELEGFKSAYQQLNRRNYADPVDADYLKRYVKVQLLRTSTGYNLYLRNSGQSPLFVKAKLRGDVVKGGEQPIYSYSYNEGIEETGTVYRETITLPNIQTSEEAETYAQYIFNRQGKPRGEFYTLTVVTDAGGFSEIVNRTIGDVLTISESQSGEVKSPHIIVGEEFELFAGRFQFTYMLSALDNTQYATIGDALTAADPSFAEFGYDNLPLYPTAGANAAIIGRQNLLNNSAPVYEIDLGGSEIATVMVGGIYAAGQPILIGTPTVAGAASTTLLPSLEYAEWRNDGVNFNHTPQNRVAVRLLGAYGGGNYVELPLTIKNAPNDGSLLSSILTISFDLILGGENTEDIEVVVLDSTKTVTIFSAVVPNSMAITKNIRIVIPGSFLSGISPMYLRLSAGNTGGAADVLITNVWGHGNTSSVLMTAPSATYAHNTYTKTTGLDIYYPTNDGTALFSNSEVSDATECSAVFYVDFDVDDLPDEVYYRVARSTTWKRLIDNIDANGKLIVPLENTSVSGTWFGGGIEFMRKPPTADILGSTASPRSKHARANNEKQKFYLMHFGVYLNEIAALNYNQIVNKSNRRPLLYI